MDTTFTDNREKDFKWEWFRHSEWFNTDVRENIPSHFSQAVARILKESSADTCLEFLCGFGKTTRQIHYQNLNIMGFDYSKSAISGAQNLAIQMKRNIPYFLGTPHSTIQETVPHRFKSIVSKDLLFETDWHSLKKTFQQIFSTLVPGGIFVFSGASEKKNFAMDLLKKYDKKPPESLLWCFRDGRTSCSKVMIKTEASTDYRDYKYLYIIEDGTEKRLEIINRRLPGYWNLKIISELVYDIGFKHFETREVERDGSQLTINIAYKEGSLNQPQHSYNEEEAYYDF